MSPNLRRSLGAASPNDTIAAGPPLGVTQQKAVTEIVRTVLDRTPMAVLTGPSGIGKTTVLREALDQLRTLGERATAIGLPKSDSAQIREVAAQALGRDTVPMTRPALDALIETVAASQRGLGPHVLLVDDVHRLIPEMFAFLHRLTNRFGAEPAWQVILSGRPEFWATVQSRERREIRAGMPTIGPLEPLSDTEARALVAYRLGRSGQAVQMGITNGALLLLLEAGQGIPGQLVVLFDTAREISASRGQRVITRDAIASAVGGGRSAIPEAGFERVKPPKSDRWLTKSIGGVSGVLVLAVGVAAWQLMVPIDGAETQAAQAGAASPAEYTQAGAANAPGMAGASPSGPAPAEAPRTPAAGAAAPGVPADLAAAVADAARLLGAEPGEAAATKRADAGAAAPPDNANLDPSRPETPAQQPAASPGFVPVEAPTAAAEAARLLGAEPGEAAATKRADAGAAAPPDSANLDPSGPETPTQQPGAAPGSGTGSDTQQAQPAPAERAGPQAPQAVMRPSMSAPTEQAAPPPPAQAPQAVMRPSASAPAEQAAPPPAAQAPQAVMRPLASALTEQAAPPAAAQAPPPVVRPSVSAPAAQAAAPPANPAGTAASAPGAQQAQPAPTAQAGPPPAQAPEAAALPANPATAAPAPSAQPAQPAPAEQAGVPPVLVPPEAGARSSTSLAPAVSGGVRPQAAPTQGAAPPVSATSPESEQAVLASPARPAAPANPNSLAPAGLDAGAASGIKRMPKAMADMLLSRGDALFAVGDVSGARLFYERAAGGGSARAATSLGKTYDPAFLATINARGMQPDPKAAAAWYRTATALGDAEAPQLLQRLGAEPNR